MLNNSQSFEGIRFLIAAFLAIVGIALTRIFSSLGNISNLSNQGRDQLLLVPTAAQSTSYYVSHANRFHP